jgi:hypothetical protein
MATDDGAADLTLSPYYLNKSKSPHKFSQALDTRAPDPERLIESARTGRCLVASMPPSGSRFGGLQGRQPHAIIIHK